MRNDRGFSLIELIIVMAIVSILFGIAFMGFRSLDSRQVGQCVKTIETYLARTKTTALAKATTAGNASLMLYRKGDGYYVDIYVNGVQEETKKIGNPDLSICYYTGTFKTEIEGAVTLELSFKRDSGAFIPLDGEGGSVYCEKIEIAKGSRQANLILVAMTGKYFVE